MLFYLVTFGRSVVWPVDWTETNTISLLTALPCQPRLARNPVPLVTDRLAQSVTANPKKTQRVKIFHSNSFSMKSSAK